MRKLIGSDRTVGGREYLACYALWFVLIALSFLVFSVLKTAALVVIGALDDNTIGIPAVYGAVLIVLGLCLFGVVMAAEYYLRSGVEKRQLRRRFARLALPLVACIVLGVVVVEVGTRLP